MTVDDMLENKWYKESVTLDHKIKKSKLYADGIFYKIFPFPISSLTVDYQVSQTFSTFLGHRVKVCKIFMVKGAQA